MHRQLHVVMFNAVYAAVGSTDTEEKVLRAKVRADGFTDADITAVLSLMERSKSIVQVRPGVWQRWHGQEAQKKLYKKEGDGE